MSCMTVVDDFRLRVIMSISRALCCFPSVKKQETSLPFFFVQCILKQFEFCDIQDNQGLGKDYLPSASADNPYLDLDYSGYHKNLIQ